jgi:HEAT repeat protein
LYLKVSWNMRTLLHPLLRMFKKQIRSLLIDCDTDDETRVVISSNIGISPVCIALEILDLPLDGRILVISLLSENKAIMKCLPWTRWLENSPGFYITVAAEVAVKTHYKEMLPALRKALAAYPVTRIIRAVGELGDRESVPALISHLSSASSYPGSLIIETLGRIGGKEAVEGLKNAIPSLEQQEKRLAFRALSGCFTGDDCAFFRDAIADPDWYIRLISVDAISRRPGPENFSALVKLSADPVHVVAQRAFYFLKYLPMSSFLPAEDVRQQEHRTVWEDCRSRSTWI